MNLPSNPTLNDVGDALRRLAANISGNPPLRLSITSEAAGFVVLIRDVRKHNSRGTGIGATVQEAVAAAFTAAFVK
jgi:hypothetical protein